MLNGGNFDETRRRTVKLTLDAVTYSLLSFLFGLAFISIKNAKILFTDISIPPSLFQVLSMFYFLFFIVFSASLLLPILMESIEQILDWVASSVLWHILTAIPFYLTVAFTLSCLVQGGITLSTSIFSLPVEYIAAGWLAYVAVIMIIDMAKPDWRDAIGNLFGGASAGNSDYLTRQLSRDDRPAMASESEGKDMRASYDSGGGGINWAFLLTGVFAVLVAGAFGYYYWQSTNTIAARNLTIATEQAQIAQLNTQVTQLTTDLTTERANSTSLLSQLNSNVTALFAANAQVAAKTLELSTSQSQATTLQSQITNLTAAKAALQTQVDNMTSIVNLSASSTPISSFPVTLSSATYTPVASSFAANYAGYLVVSGSSSTANGYIMVNVSGNSYYPSAFNNYHYGFGTGITQYVPILPGTVTVYYGNTDASSTATISVLYQY
jgi:F0F1-type ATP synthase membrane subunit b/b'